MNWMPTSVRPSSVACPVVISRKLSKIDPWNTVRKLAALILLPQFGSSPDVLCGGATAPFSEPYIERYIILIYGSAPSQMTVGLADTEGRFLEQPGHAYRCG